MTHRLRFLRKHPLHAVAGVLLSALSADGHASDATAAGKVSFNRDIRPILSDTCFQCHGFDEKERKAGLRLDDRASAVKPAESGEIAIVPGSPEKSALIARLTSKDRDEVMPPPKLHKTITPEQVELFKKWIAQGAEYQGHWSFIKPERPKVPARSGAIPVADPPKREAPNPLPGVSTPGAMNVAPPSSNPIDAFIRERLEGTGLKPSPEAAPETLIRRMTLDLTGLPPTPEEVRAFVRDYQSPVTNHQSPGAAVARLADRLLASPRYGEHMAARWLDMARYADSNGFQSDTQRHMWPWRDWVIAAFNRNLPFDQFTIEQLAGDLLPGATRDQIVATGFNRNHRLNGEGGRIVEEWFAETVIDRVETTGLTWMGLTFNCCRCHDHKYDPISQKEFYQLFAYFNSNNEMGVLDDFGGAGRTRRGGNSRPILPLPTPEQAAQIAKLEKAVADANAALPVARQDMARAQAEWEPKFRTEMKGGLKPWTPVEPREVRSDGGAVFEKQTDGSWLATGINPPFDQYLTLAPIAEGTLSGLLLEVFPDASLPNKSVGRYSNGNFVLTDVIVEVNAPGLAKPLRVDFTRAEADYNQKGYEVKAIVENRPKRGGKKRGAQGWAVDGPKLREARKAMFITDTPVTVPPGATLSVTLRHDSITGHNIGRFRLSTTGLPPATVKLDGAKVPPALVAAIEAKPETRTAAQKTELAKFFRENADNPMKRAEAAIAAAKKALENFQGDVINTMVMEELPQPREARLLLRGEYDKPGDPVPRALPAVLPPLPAGAPNDRLGLARWLVSGEHPLTARVWVNREWERFFGTGLVKTSENLGSQAEWPSHPELLDWLATEFVRLNWDMKAMQRLIVTSATYRQSSVFSKSVFSIQNERASASLNTDALNTEYSIDPENRLLSRQNRLRLPAETLRDQALAIGGLLVEKVGGPSVRPYMPERVWDETSVYGDMRNYTPDTGDALYRRALYTIWKRTAPPPSMALFDSPAREICTVKRSRTNTPLQALALLNEVTYVEAARVFAQRMIAEGGATPEARIAWAFARATGRPPRPEELAVLANGLTKRLARFSTTPEAATQLTTVGASKPDAKLAAAELAAYTLTANVLLNLDEVVTRE